MSNLNSTMVCVTRQRSCERLIRTGFERTKGKGQLYVVHVVKEGENYLGNPDEGEALEYLFKVSKQFDAEMTVIRSEKVLSTIENFAKEQHIRTIVLGESPEESGRDNLVEKIKNKLESVEFVVVSAE